jgi:hypothetical protein
MLNQAARYKNVEAVSIKYYAFLAMALDANEPSGKYPTGHSYETEWAPQPIWTFKSLPLPETKSWSFSQQPRYRTDCANSFILEQDLSHLKIWRDIYVEHAKVIRHMNNEVMAVRRIIADFLSQAHTEKKTAGPFSQGPWARLWGWPNII